MDARQRLRWLAPVFERWFYSCYGYRGRLSDRAHARCMFASYQRLAASAKFVTGLDLTSISRPASVGHERDQVTPPLQAKASTRNKYERFGQGVCSDVLSRCPSPLPSVTMQWSTSMTVRQATWLSNKAKRARQADAGRQRRHRRRVWHLRHKRTGSPAARLRSPCAY